MESFIPGLIEIYWCSQCSNIDTTERSCPFCSGTQKKIGWVENG